MSLFHFIIAFISASLAGVILGLLGGGIGLVLIPIMLWLLQSQGINNALIMHIAIGTTVASIVVVGTVASYEHHKNNSIDWRIGKDMVGGLTVGLVIGSIVASYLPTHLLMVLFSLFVLLLAFYVFFSKNTHQTLASETKHLLLKLNVGACLIGFIGSVLGANPITVPFLKRLGVDIVTAIGTTVVIGTIMAVGIVFMFVITGWGEKGLPPYSTGYVDWAMFMPFAIASSLFAPLGVKLAHYLPKQVLRRMYGSLLLIIGIKMLLSV